MDDPREFGQQLADKTVARMESEGLSSDEAAIFAAQQIVERADEWLLQARAARQLPLGRSLPHWRMARALTSGSKGLRS